MVLDWVQGLAYIVRALLVAWGNALPAWLVLPDDHQMGRAGRLAGLRAASQHASALSGMLLERQHQAFVAEDDNGACGAVTSLTIADNPLTAKGLQEVLHLFDPDIGEQVSAKPHNNSHSRCNVHCIEYSAEFDLHKKFIKQVHYNSCATLC